MGSQDVLAQVEKDFKACRSREDKLAFGKLYNRTWENFDKDKPKAKDRRAEMVEKVEKMTGGEF